MRSKKSLLELPGHTLAPLTSIPGQWDPSRAASFLAESPLIVVNSTPESARNPFHEMILRHEIYHHKFIFKFIPLHSLFWPEIEALEAVDAFLQERLGQSVIKINSRTASGISPIHLSELPVLKEITSKKINPLILLCESFALLEHLLLWPLEERKAFFYELLDTTGVSPDLLALLKLLELKTHPYDLLAVINIDALGALIRNNAVEFRNLFDQCDSIIDQRNRRVKALDTVLSAACASFSTRVFEENNDMSSCLSSAEKTFYTYTNFIYERCASLIETHRKKLKRPIPALITHIAASTFLTFYDGYAGRYAQDDRFDDLSAAAASSGGYSIPVLWADALGCLDLGPDSLEHILKRCETDNKPSQFAEWREPPESLAMRWVEYLFLRTIRTWMAGTKELLCPVFSFFSGHLRENEGRLNNFCGTTLQSKEYCCVANNELHLERARDMACPFGRFLCKLFEDCDRVEILNQ